MQILNRSSTLHLALSLSLSFSVSLSLSHSLSLSLSRSLSLSLLFSVSLSLSFSVSLSLSFSVSLSLSLVLSFSLHFWNHILGKNGGLLRGFLLAVGRVEICCTGYPQSIIQPGARVPIHQCLFRPSVTVSQISLMESCTCYCGGPPPSTILCTDEAYLSSCETLLRKKNYQLLPDQTLLQSGSWYFFRLDLWTRYLAKNTTCQIPAIRSCP